MALKSDLEQTEGEFKGKVFTGNQAFLSDTMMSPNAEQLSQNPAQEKKDQEPALVPGGALERGFWSDLGSAVIQVATPTVNHGLNAPGASQDAFQAASVGVGLTGAAVEGIGQAAGLVGSSHVLGSFAGPLDMGADAITTAGNIYHHAQEGNYAGVAGDAANFAAGQAAGIACTVGSAPFVGPLAGAVGEGCEMAAGAGAQAIVESVYYNVTGTKPPEQPLTQAQKEQAEFDAFLESIPNKVEPGMTTQEAEWVKLKQQITMANAAIDANVAVFGASDNGNARLTQLRQDRDRAEDAFLNRFETAVASNEPLPFVDKPQTQYAALETEKTFEISAPALSVAQAKSISGKSFSMG